MPDNLNEVTRAKIRELCVEMAAENALDPDACDEICRQLEDKLTGYVSGEVRPTEEDALVLARAHFGNADRVARSLSTFSAEADAELTERERTVRKLGIALALFTFVALTCTFAIPLAMAFRDISHGDGGPVSQPLGSAALKFVLGVIVFLGAIETAVVLAIRVNLRNTWQRLTGAAFVLPSIALCFCILGGSFGGLLTTGSADSLPLRLLFVSLTLAGLIGLMGHLWLIGLLLVPPPCGPGPLADKT